MAEQEDRVHFGSAKDPIPRGQEQWGEESSHHKWTYKYSGCGALGWKPDERMILEKKISIDIAPIRPSGNGKSSHALLRQ